MKLCTLETDPDTVPTSAIGTCELLFFVWRFRRRVEPVHEMDRKLLFYCGTIIAWTVPPIQHLPAAPGRLFSAPLAREMTLSLCFLAHAAGHLYLLGINDNK